MMTPPTIEFLQKCADTTEITNTLGKWLDAKPENKELLGIYNSFIILLNFL